MKKNECLDIKQKIEEGELVPFHIIKKYMDYKIYNNIDVDKLINYYRINDSVSYNYLKQIDSEKEYSKFLVEFNKFKFSLSKEHLKEISEKLIQKDFEEQKEFFELEPNKFFIYVYKQLYNLLESKIDDNSKRGNIFYFIEKWYNIYKKINEMVLFPTLIASKNYCYNKLIFDFMHSLLLFIKKRNNKKEGKTSYVKSNEPEDENEPDANQEPEDEGENEHESEDENEIKLENEKEPKYGGNKLNKNEIKIKEVKKVKFYTSKIEKMGINLLKKKRNKSEVLGINEYISYANDKEYVESFQKLLTFLKPFQKVFEIISENENDEINILRTQIFILNLNFYEKERSKFDENSLKKICKVL